MKRPNRLALPLAFLPSVSPFALHSSSSTKSSRTHRQLHWHHKATRLSLQAASKRSALPRHLLFVRRSPLARKMANNNNDTAPHRPDLSSLFMYSASPSSRSNGASSVASGGCPGEASEKTVKLSILSLSPCLTPRRHGIRHAIGHRSCHASHLQQTRRPTRKWSLLLVTCAPQHQPL